MESYQLRHFRQVLGNRYEFQAFLGRGAFASVYLVQNLKLKRREALKILADTFEPDSTARFVEEARLVASLDHPNIVQVYDYGQVEGLIWYSMQYVEGPMQCSRGARRSTRRNPFNCCCCACAKIRRASPRSSRRSTRSSKRS